MPHHRPLLALLALTGLAGTALAQSATDSCAAAPAITPGIFLGSTVESSNDGASGCGAADASPDVWYKFVAPSAGQLIVETCGGSTNYDTVLAIHSGCGAGTVLTCNDDTCGLQSHVQVDTTAGSTYYIRIAGFGNATGTYTLAVTFNQPPPPGPDSCANATLVTPGSYNGSTAGTTNDGTANCGGAEASPDVWYKITPATDRQLIADTCGGITNFDTVLSIHSDCTPGSTLTCNDDNCGLQSRVQVNAIGGQTYYIRVAGYFGSTGDFTLNVALSDPPPPPTHGPDVTVVDNIDIAFYGTENGINAYAVGTNSCNVGDAPVAWYNGTPFHPVIAQNMFRLNNGRFEQVGLSWLKHGFASTNSPGCGTCVQPPDGGQQLGVACTDAYGSGLNGSQGNLGPRSEVNVATGIYTYPPGNPSFAGAIARRLQVRQTDLDPATNSGALYFVDTHYVTQDDAQWNNGHNNLSYRAITAPGLAGTPNFAGATHWQQPGIRAWADTDASVALSNADYTESYTINANTVNITSRFVLGTKVTNNNNGTWTYEYAVQNINSHRSGGSFSIPVPDSAAVSGIGFHGVFYHSGEPYDNSDWTVSRSNGAITWRSPQTFEQNPNSNALRWSTLYNFRFTTDVAPSAGNATIGLFRTGTPSAVSGATQIPTPVGCDPDLNQDGNADQDDVAYLINVVGGGDNPTNIDPDFNHDGNADQDDIAALINAVGGGGCP